MPDRLTALQREILQTFFRRERAFVLTGGAALAGYHLGHRETYDLDLFTAEDLLDRGDRALRDAAAEIGASVEAVQTSPTFRRRLVQRGAEGVVVDLVQDTSARSDVPVLDVGGVRVDPPEEILANKLTTLLSRAEIRDLVDVALLEAHGYAVDSALPLARRKDAGLTPAQLGWVLSQIEIPDGARLPGGLEPAALRQFLEGLRKRLARLAFPEAP